MLVTTHNPALAGLVPVNCVRFVERTGTQTVVSAGTDDVAEKVTRALGVLPDNRIAAIVCVEGPTDVAFLKHASHIYNKVDPDIPDLLESKEVAFVPTGGSTLQQWVDERYLKEFGRPCIHLYDRGSETPPAYAGRIEQLQAEGENARLTGKREIENYYHHEAVQEIYGIPIAPFGNDDRVPDLIARAVHENANTGRRWDELEDTTRKSKTSRVKQRLCAEVLPLMNHERLQAADLTGDIPAFLRDVSRICSEYRRND